MADDRDITERLEAVAGFGGTHLDGIWSEAAKEIRALRAKIKEQDEWNSLRAMDIVTLGQEVGRLREERPQIDYVIDSVGVTHRSFTLVYKTRAALAEQEEK